MKAPIRDTLGGIPIPQSWVTWFETVDNFIRSGSSSGTTANRPTKNLFVGLSYMDTDLGKQIQIQSLNPTVWVDSNGDDPDAPAVVTETPQFINVYLESANYVNIPTGRVSLSSTKCPWVEIDGQTRVRCIFYVGGSSVGAGVYFGMSYDTSPNVTPYASSTEDITASGYSVFVTDVAATIVDTGWLDLAEGVTGAIFPNFWADGATAGTEDIAIQNAYFAFK